MRLDFSSTVEPARLHGKLCVRPSQPPTPPAPPPLAARGGDEATEALVLSRAANCVPVAVAPADGDSGSSVVVTFLSPLARTPLPLQYKRVLGHLSRYGIR